MKIILYYFTFLISTVQIPWYHKTHLQIEKIVESLEEYKLDCGYYPSSLEELVNSSKACWEGPYASSKMFVDKFNQISYKYFVKNNEILIISAGKDGEFGTKDDFKSSDTLKGKDRLYKLYESLKNTEKIKLYIIYVSVFLVLIFIYRVIRKK